MQFFLLPFSQFWPFWISAAVAVLMVVIIVRSAMVAEGGSNWAKSITSPNAKFLFTFLFIGWAVVFGIGLQLVPHTGANSAYGALGLIAMFTGFFIMMGLLWAIIGE